MLSKDWGGKLVKVTFNGVELTKWITVLDGFTLLDGADYEPIFRDYETIDGSEYVYSRKKSKKIPVPFYVKYESMDNHDDLQKVLNVSEPKELTFSIAPDRVFYAIPTGNLDFKEIKLNGKGTITFIISDGLAHAKNPKYFEFKKNAQGVLEAEIINNGSAEIPVNYRIKLKHESGYVGIVSQYGAMQFGKIEEADAVEEKKNVLLSGNTNGDFSNWTDGTIFYENQGKKVVTKMTADSSFGGRLGVFQSGFSDPSNSAFFGAVKELNLSEQAKDWYIWARAWFEAGLMGQTGAWCLSVVDSDNYFIAGMAIEKHDRVGNQAKIFFLLGDGSGNSRIVKTINFTASYWVKDNIYGNESRINNRNMFDLRKEGDKVTFFHNGHYFPYFESKLRDVKAAKVQFFVGQIKGRDSTLNQFVTHHYLNDFAFYKLNASFWRDVPNRYPTGSELFIDATGEVNPEEKGRLYVNNLLAPDDEILGTDYFKVPPGKTKVQLLVSSFAEVGSARAEIEEAWI